MGLTLATIRQWIQDHTNENTSTRGQRIQNRIANSALHVLHASGDWEFDRGLVRLVFEAVKSTGTVSVAAGGTAMTGVGTSFQSTDVGKFFRLQGQGLQYRMTARASETACTIEAYREATALSGGTFELTQDRVPLPARYRKLIKAQHVDDVGGLQEVSMDRMSYMRMHERAVSTPIYCAFDGTSDPDNTDGQSGSKYVWVYPLPVSQFVLQMPAYLKPVEMSADAHGISAPYEAEEAYLELVRAFCYREAGELDKFTTQYAIALQAIVRDLGAFRSRGRFQQREMWECEVDGDLGGREKTVIDAPGESF
jgi:hypothetical protein